MYEQEVRVSLRISQLARLWAFGKEKHVVTHQPERINSSHVSCLTPVFLFAVFRRVILPFSYHAQLGDNDFFSRIVVSSILMTPCALVGALQCGVPNVVRADHFAVFSLRPYLVFSSLKVFS
jgi:hypothetical protein